MRLCLLGSRGRRALTVFVAPDSVRQSIRGRAEGGRIRRIRKSVADSFSDAPTRADAHLLLRDGIGPGLDLMATTSRPSSSSPNAGSTRDERTRRRDGIHRAAVAFFRRLPAQFRTLTSGTRSSAPAWRWRCAALAACRFSAATTALPPLGGAGVGTLRRLALRMACRRSVAALAGRTA